MTNLTLHTDIKQGSKSFYFASFFLPSALRKDIAYLYSICREIDDIGDFASAKGFTDEMAKAKIREIVENSEVQAFFNTHSIPLQYLFDLSEGVMGDLHKKRYQTFEELYVYCYQVAGSVGRMIACMFGVKDEAILLQAEQLGIAMQLTNIIRDIEEDLERGLFFIPQELLQKYAVTEFDFTERRFNSAIQGVIKELVATAEYYYELGEKGIVHLPRKTRVGIRFASFVYSGILDKVRRNDYNPFRGRVYLTLWEKVWRVVSLSLHRN